MRSPYDFTTDFSIAPVGVSVLDRCHDYVSGLQKHSLTDQESFERRLLSKQLHHVVADNFNVIEVVHDFAAACLVITQIVGWTFLSDCESKKRNDYPAPDVASLWET